MRPVIKQTTALVASYAAGLAVGFFKDVEELRANWALDYIWRPHMEEGVREETYRMWKKAITRSFDWVEDAPKNAQPPQTHW